MDIQYEANPFWYKLPPGYNKEVFGPVYLEMLLLLKKISERNQSLTSDDEERINSLEQKLRTLNAGGMVGSPRRKL